MEEREKLKVEIEKISDEKTIEKIRLFILGIITQSKIEKAKGEENNEQKESPYTISKV